MANPIVFIFNNFFSIMFLTILLFGTLIIFSFLNDKFKNIPPYSEDTTDTDNKILKQINVETFTNEMSGKSFCSTFQSFPTQLREKCNDLGKNGCHIPPCCVLRNGTDCVPGDQHGPTFLTELGKEIKTLFFNHQGKCIPGRGSCPE